MDAAIEKVLQQMIHSLNLGNISRPEQEEVITELGRNMLQRIALEAYGELSPEDSQKMDEYIRKQDADNFAKFLNEKVPHFEQLAMRISNEVVQEFKEEFANA